MNGLKGHEMTTLAGLLEWYETTAAQGRLGQSCRPCLQSYQGSEQIKTGQGVHRRGLGSPERGDRVKERGGLQSRLRGRWVHKGSWYSGKRSSDRLEGDA
jgi:hypothetical protein